MVQDRSRRRQSTVRPRGRTTESRRTTSFAHDCAHGTIKERAPSRQPLASLSGTKARRDKCCRKLPRKAILQGRVAVQMKSIVSAASSEIVCSNLVSTRHRAGLRQELHWCQSSLEPTLPLHCCRLRPTSRPQQASRP
ncbi:hypothetical protein L1887_57567 [Cichorium endivia]|nr:hypothetical protein L1887_57567 [Cichorium endivia]